MKKKGKVKPYPKKGTSVDPNKLIKRAIKKA